MSDQAKRVRSPNYPAVSLAHAVKQLDALYERIHKHAAPKEAVAKGLGYGGFNGQSAMVLSAHTKFGLLERVDSERFKITDRAMRIMFSSDAAEKAAAIWEAAQAPSLYGELIEAYGNAPPHDDILRPWLMRRGFAAAAVPAVIQGYRDTMALVLSNSEEYDSSSDQHEDQSMSLEPSTQSAGKVHQLSAIAPQGRQEKIADDEGNQIVLTFPSEPTIETYEFIKEYLEFRIQRLSRTAKQKMDDLLS